MATGDEGVEMHKSRLGALIVDCQTDDLAREAEFWSAALGGEIRRPEGDGRYIDIVGDAREPHVILQRVEHASRVHLDIETDDIEAEVARLERLGASVVEKLERWTVMQAPSGHRFCIIGPRRADFESRANSWE